VVDQVAIGDILRRISAAREFNRLSVELVEYSESAPMDQPRLSVVQSCYGQLAEAGITVSSDFRPSAISHRLCASHIVGATRLYSDNAELLLRIEPKIGNAALFKILNFIDDSPFKDEEAASFTSTDDLAFHQAARCISIICSAINGLGNKVYIDVELDNQDSIKGRPDYIDYFTKKIPGHRPNKINIHCQELSLNHLRNQIFLAALNKSRLLLCGSSKYVDEKRRALSAISLLRGTTNRPSFEAKEIESAIRLAAHHHRAALFSAQRILQNISIGLSPGKSHSYFKFLINMNDVFQRYAISLFNKASGGTYRPGCRSHWIDEINREMKLDGFLVSSDSRIVIECKYKKIESNTDRILLPDIYQINSYCAHRSILANCGFLVYPGGSASDVRGARILTKIHSVTGGAMIIYIVEINLSKPPRDIITDLSGIIAQSLEVKKA